MECSSDRYTGIGDLRMRLPAVLALGFVVLFSLTALAELVKKSKRGICHDTGSPYYECTKNFVAFDSLD